jgi:penicillin amidase
VTANERIHDDEYPHLIGVDFHAADRATRITELLEEHGNHTVDSCRRIQADTVSISARSLLPRLSIEEERVRSLFDGWDHDLDARSAAAALWEVFVDELSRRVLGGAEPLTEEYLTDRELFRCRALPSLLDEDVLTARQCDDALAAAWDRCSAAMGPEPEDWSWGAIHRAAFAHPLGLMPGLEPLFVAADHPLGGDEQTVNNAGFEGEGPFRVYVAPSWRVVYDLSDLDASAGVVPTGQSGNPASPHWNDQTEMWATGSLRPLPFTSAAVEEAATDRLALIPA